ncbi:oligosaccharide flippase family protein [Chryseobacterium sp. RR2-3-20]|uniref:oligosaccharide flippase family protein n=1 Tax=Chryseobacterium sp. RR2-3-20 TaxID=2787626 RepID=UPI001ADF8B24|nr:oligosaccharide flippase family protein [Chryseobacterium sp. RR2-3-20]
MNIKAKINNFLSSELNKKILNHSFWILIGNVISKFALLVATIFVTKYLGKKEYGQFGIIKSTILMFAMFAGLELGMTATKYISQYKSTDKLKVERIVGLSTLFSIIISIAVTVLIFFFAKEIAIQIKAENLVQEIKISSFILFFSSLNGIQNGILSGIEKFKEQSINGAIAGVFSCVFLVLTSKYYNLDMVIIAFGFNYVIIFLLNLYTLRFFYKDFKIKIFDKKNLKEFQVLWKFSLPAILAGVMIAPVIWLCNYLLVNQPNGYSEMASFDIANQWRNTVLFIPSALAQIALPMLASQVGNKKEYRIILNKNIKMNLYIGISFSLIFIILSPIITLVYGKDYKDTQIPLIIMFLTTALITVNNVVGQGIASQGKMWIGFYVNLAWAIILISCTYILVQRYQFGAIGLSFSYLVSYIFHTVVQYFILKKFL